MLETGVRRSSAPQGADAISSETRTEPGRWMRMNTVGSFPIATTRWTVLGNSRAIRIYRRRRRYSFRPTVLCSITPCAGPVPVLGPDPPYRNRSTERSSYLRMDEFRALARALRVPLAQTL